jgi:VWFA-related protein
MNRRLAAFLFSAVLVVPLALTQVREKRVTPIPEQQQQQFDRQRRAGVAILVGVGKYPPFSGFNELRYPSRDVDQLAAELEKQRYLVIPIKEADATRQAVLNAIEQSGDAAQSAGGSMVFYFTGHGFEDHGANYLALHDAAANRLSESGLAVKDVESAMQRAGVTRRVLWIDACRNEPSKGIGNRSFARFEAAAGTRILFSTKAGSVSYEDDGLQDGLFTYYLLAGLRGAAAGPDGLITFRDLTDYVVDGVEGHSLKQGRRQIPYEAGESSGDFLLGRAMGTTAGETVSDRPTAPAPVGANTTTHVTSAPVQVSVSVLNSEGRLIPSISRESFRVMKNTLPQPIVKFSESKADFATIAILIEYSQRDSKESQQYVEAAGQLLDGLNAADYVAIATFDLSPKILFDFTTDRATAHAALNRLVTPAFSGSSLFTAVADLAGRMKNVQGRKAIVLFASGMDTFSKLTFDRTRAALKEAGVPIFAVSAAPSSIRLGGSSLDHLQADNQLRAFANETGGKPFFFKSSFELANINSAIKDAFHDGEGAVGGYTIFYQPSDPEGDIRVELVKPQTNEPLRILDPKGADIKYRMVVTQQASSR